jgi:succinoglycan biosynthesis transport protein ExoP
MQDDQLPAGPTEGEDRLPALGSQAANRQVPALNRPQTVSTEVLEGPERDDRDEIDLLAYWQMLVKRRWLILGVLSTVVAIALMLTLLTPSTYQATALLQIDNGSTQMMPLNNISMPTSYDRDFGQTQIELLKSRSLAERVADSLRLVGSDIFARLEPPSWWQRLKDLVTPASRARRGAATQASPKQDKTSGPSETAQLREAAGLIQHGLAVDQVPNSSLVKVSYTSVLTAFSAQVANAVVDGFIASSLDRQLGASSYARTYLQDQLAQMKSQLENSERQLVAFAQKENIIPATDGKSLVAQNLSDLNTALAGAQDRRIRAEARWKQAQSVSGTALPADMLNNPNLQALQQRRMELQGKYEEKLQVFKPGFPEMLALHGQIAAVDKQIATELGNIRASVKAEYDSAASQETMLIAQLNTLRAQTLEVDSRSIKYNILKRDVDTNRQLYDSLLQRYKEVGVAGGVKNSNISIVDRAEVPSRRFAPSLSRNLSLGLLAGLLLGVMLALLLEYLDDTLKTPNDVEHHLRMAVLGIIPKLTKQTPTEALKDPRSAFSESYRSVRTALQFSTERGVPKVLLITSAGPSEGKSTSALTLARNFAHLGKRVLLIEGDLRHPTLSKVTRLSTAVGLSNLLAGGAAMAEAVIKTDDEHLDVILAGPLPPDPTELLSGRKLVSLLMTSIERYDQIIIDGPPVLGIADAPLLASVATGTLLVVHSGETQITDAQAAIKRLKASRARVIGCLLTQYDAKVASYAYAGAYAGPAPRLKGK